MDEITIRDKVYISTKRAAAITGYAKDYVGQLCREGRVEATLVGRSWYVLESAIREHRFGKKDDEPAVEVTKEATAVVPEPVKTWQRPEYVPEEPQFVPTLTPKREEAIQEPVVVAPIIQEVAPEPVYTPESVHPAVEDMQAAWKEWFGKKTPEALPDGSEDFTGELVPVVMPSEEVPVRVEKQKQEEIEQTEAEEVETETVPLHRSYASRSTGEVIPETNVPVIDLSTTKRVKQVSEARTQSTSGGSGVVKALSIAMGLIALTIAAIGTGYAEQFLNGTGLNFGIQQEIIEFLGGTRTVNK